MEQIKLHSITDLITNSSTTIYTYSEGSITPCKELINEVLELAGEGKKCDDIFELSIEKDNDQLVDQLVDRMSDELEDLLDEDEYKALKIPDDWDKGDKRRKQILEEIQSGKRPEPDWYEELSEDIQGDTTLVIRVKDDKYKKLAKLVVDFLYSTQAEEGEN